MAELKAITDKILQTAEEEGREIISLAEAEKEKALAEAREKGEQDKKQIIEDARKESERITTRAISKASQQSSQSLLDLKMKLINKTMEQAEQKILNAPDNEYMERLTKLLSKKAHKDEKGGVIAFNKKDKARLSDDMKKAISDFSLTVSEKDAEISGGFVLSYGNIEENCDVDAIFRENYEHLVDVIGASLYC